jgi:PPOX class probable F420-dependent enzyme
VSEDVRTPWEGLDPLARLLVSHDLGTLATIKQDGRPQLSLVNYHFEPEHSRIRISVREPLAKTRNLRRDPRVSLSVQSPDGHRYVVAEGTAELSATAKDEHDEVVAELVEVYRLIRGNHPDWDDYRRAMVRDQRVVLRIAVERAYGRA